MNNIIKHEELDNLPIPAEAFQKTEIALIECEKAMQTWTRSHSNFTWKNMTIGGEYSNLRRLRQVAAELKRKKAALTEAKYKYLKKLQMAEVYEEEAKDVSLASAKRRLKELQAEEARETSKLVYEPYLGAMKDVIELKKLHDSLITQITEEYGKFDEEVFEIEEAKYWVKRIFAQALRDMRQSNSITSGNQEALEQIGLDPLIVQSLLGGFLNEQQQTENKNISSHGIEHFLEECAKEYSPASKDKIKRIGLPCEIDTETLLLDNSSEE